MPALLVHVDDIFAAGEKAISYLFGRNLGQVVQAKNLRELRCVGPSRYS